MKNLHQTIDSWLVLILVLLVLNTQVSGQTYPEPYNLSGGAYSFTSWDSASLAGTFPPNMIFHFVDTNQLAPFYADGISDYDCSYNKTKRPRINGLVDEGISFLTTSNSQWNNCVSGASSERFIGAALVSLNASGRGNINVSWKSETLIPGDGTPNPRIWNLRFQYRVGSSGLFKDVPGPVEYIASSSAGSTQTFGPTLLPSECWNEPLVQVRWIYFESSAGNVGSRPKLRLDDIEITSDVFQGIDDPKANVNAFFRIYPNPASGQFTIKAEAFLHGSIKISDVFGKELLAEGVNSQEKLIDCSSLPEGVYFVQVSDNLKGLVSTIKILIQ